MNELVSHGRRNFEITLDAHPHLLNLKSGRSAIRSVLMPPLSTGPTLSLTLHDTGGPFFKIGTHNGRLLVEADRSFLEQSVFTVLISDVLERLLRLSEPFTSISMGSYYLPAARSGILQGHKVLTSERIKIGGKSYGILPKRCVTKLSVILKLT